MKTFIFAATVLAAATTAQAQDEKHFDGAYLGGDLGYEDVGDNVNGYYLGLFGGYRIQNDSDFVFGLEGTFGKTFADVNIFGAHFDDVYDYEWTVMGTVGKAFGTEKRSLLTLGAGIVQQKATVTYGDFSASATGESFAVALGYEHAMGDTLSFRVRATTYEFDTLAGTVGVGFRF